MTEKYIICVDDEQIILNTLKQTNHFKIWQRLHHRNRREWRRGVRAFGGANKRWRGGRDDDQRSDYARNERRRAFSPSLYLP